jgi:hypothetical protein
MSCGAIHLLGTGAAGHQRLRARAGARVAQLGLLQRHQLQLFQPLARLLDLLAQGGRLGALRRVHQAVDGADQRHQRGHAGQQLLAQRPTRQPAAQRIELHGAGLKRRASCCATCSSPN